MVWALAQAFMAIKLSQRLCQAHAKVPANKHIPRYPEGDGWGD
jgi:hypothetical protein